MPFLCELKHATWVVSFLFKKTKNRNRAFLTVELLLRERRTPRPAYSNRLPVTLPASHRGGLRAGREGVRAVGTDILSAWEELGGSRAGMRNGFCGVTSSTWGARWWHKRVACGCTGRPQRSTGRQGVFLFFHPPRPARSCAHTSDSGQLGDERPFVGKGEAATAAPRELEATQASHEHAPSRYKKTGRPKFNRTSTRTHCPSPTIAVCSRKNPWRLARALYAMNPMNLYMNP